MTQFILSFYFDTVCSLRPGAVLVNASCNEQMFFLNPGKKKLTQNPQIRLVVFEKNVKSHTFIPKNSVTEPKARLLESPVKLLTG